MEQIRGFHIAGIQAQGFASVVGGLGEVVRGQGILSLAEQKPDLILPALQRLGFLDALQQLLCASALGFQKEHFFGANGSALKLFLEKRLLAFGQECGDFFPFFFFLPRIVEPSQDVLGLRVLGIQEHDLLRPQSRFFVLVAEQSLLSTGDELGYFVLLAFLFLSPVYFGKEIRGLVLVGDQFQRSLGVCAGVIKRLGAQRFPGFRDFRLGLGAKLVGANGLPRFFNADS